MEPYRSVQSEGIQSYDLSSYLLPYYAHSYPYTSESMAALFTHAWQLMFIVHNRSRLHSGWAMLGIKFYPRAHFKFQWLLKLDLFLNHIILSIHSRTPALRKNNIKLNVKNSTNLFQNRNYCYWKFNASTSIECWMNSRDTIANSVWFLLYFEKTNLCNILIKAFNKLVIKLWNLTRELI